MNVPITLANLAALISDLYAQVNQLTEENRLLRAQIQPPPSPPPAPTETALNDQ